MCFNKSNCLPVLSDDPQGSKCGLQLFLAYTNNLQSALETCQLFLFADYTIDLHFVHLYKVSAQA